MERYQAIEHLRALKVQEERSARMPRDWLGRREARDAEQRHWNNVEALIYALRELEEYKPIARGPEPCPQPVAEGDEYKCLLCLRRWGRDEEKPQCQN